MVSARLQATSAPLETIIRVAGGHNWTPAMIEAHKARELAAAPPSSPIYAWSNTLSTCLFLVFLCSCYGAFASLYFENAMGLVASAVGISSTLELHKLKIRGPAQWQVMTPTQYEVILKTELPPQATAIVSKIKHFCPDIECKVHVLTQDNSMLDPILEVDGYFVLVWDDAGNIILPPV